MPNNGFSRITEKGDSLGFEAMMKKKSLIQMVQNPNFIPGVYNYCDRWCERCPLTSRCANFAFGEQHFSSLEDRDINNARFWQELHEVFQLTLEMVMETAEELGIDLTDLDLETAAEKEMQLKEAAHKHGCVRAAKKYSKMVTEWFDLRKGLFEQKEDDLNLQVNLDLPGTNPFAEAARLKDAVEVIRWYQHQIYVKLMRAIKGELEETPEILKEYPKDSDGSAKVALIGLDRSIAAWGAVRSHFPNEEDSIFELLIGLERLRSKVKEVFPNARFFIRSGFDDM